MFWCARLDRFIRCQTQHGARLRCMPHHELDGGLTITRRAGIRARARQPPGNVGARRGNQKRGRPSPSTSLPSLPHAQANTAINKTKESVEVVKEWFRDPAVVAENRILAARPSPAVAKKYTTQKDAADKAVKNVAGSSATVAGGAVAYTGRGDEGAPRAVALDFSSSSDLSLALADGDLQPAADAMLAAAGANKTDAFSKAVGDMLVVTDPAPPAAALGAAVGVALREAPDAIFTPTSGGNNAKPPASGVAEAFVTGLVAAVKPCAADVTVKTGGSATAPNRAWAEAAAKTCCPYVTPAIRGAQAAVEGGSADAKRVLYSALSRSVALGGEGGFALARCTSPNAKE